MGHERDAVSSLGQPSLLACARPAVSTSSLCRPIGARVLEGVAPSRALQGHDLDGGWRGSGEEGD